MLKKAHETENLSAKERWNKKENLHLSWIFFLPIVKVPQIGSFFQKNVFHFFR